MTQPLTRDLRQTIRSLEVSEAELLFQADRLANRPRTDTAQEGEHLADLEKGYREAAKYTRILINYHEGRANRGMNSRGRPLPDDGIDGRGNARANTTD